MHTIVFDLDGTLIDSLPGIADSLNRVMIGHGLPGHSFANVRNFIGDGAKKLAERSLKDVRRPDLIPSVLAGFRKDYAMTWQHGTKPYAGILPLLNQLQSDGHQLAVLSNKPHPFTEEIVTQLFPKNCFKMVLGHREGKQLKPNPESLLELLNTLEADREKTCLVGDSSVDIQTAAHAGINSIGVLWGYQDEERLAQANCLMSSIEELSKHFSTL